MEKNLLQSGFTTGSCAAIASKASAYMLFSQKKTFKETIITPKGTTYTTAILESYFDGEKGVCAVKKFSGDDPDVTNGLLIFSEVKKADHNQVLVLNGKGVGTVTKKGLQRKIGEPAINPIPLKMILQEVNTVKEMFSYSGGLDITISVPQGEVIAKKTFNSRLGIVGGISILGTSGIVEPMSQKAIIDTVKLEINQKIFNDKVLFCFGNYGENFLKENFHIENKAVQCSNFIGDALEYANNKNVNEILIIGHIGKIIKLAGGLLNTHSMYGDCRMEILASHSLICDTDASIVKKIIASNTTEEAIDFIYDLENFNNIFESIEKKIKYHINYRLKKDMDIKLIIFSNDKGTIFKSKNCETFLKKLH